MTKNTDDSVHTGNMVRVQTPKFLSLVDLPANSVAFKVVRKDGGEPAAASGSARRIRRSTTNPVLHVAFAGLQPDEIDAVLNEFGMTDYSISSQDGMVIATRSDLQTFAKDDLEAIKLREGVTAYVERSEVIQRADTTNHLKLTAVEFDAEKFDEESANAWLTEKGVDITVTRAENPDQPLVAKRSDVAEGVEVRRMQVEDGVVLFIVQDQQLDVPPAIFEVISEAAYGNWGWGQMDFNARLADREFCEKMEDAIWIMKDTVYSLVFYSGLPLDVRQTLISNALSQFNDYVKALMSQLPRQVLVAVAKNSDTITRSHRNTESTMSTEDKNKPAATPVARTDDQGGAAGSGAGADQTITLTQAELDARVDAEITRRADAARAADEAAAQAAAEGADNPNAEILRRFDALQEVVNKQNETIQSLNERIAAPVVVRSEPVGAPEGTKTEDGKGTAVKRSDDPFAGMFIRQPE